MSWLSVSFEVADSDVEAVTDALLAARRNAVQNQVHAIFHSADEEDEGWVLLSGIRR